MTGSDQAHSRVFGKDGMDDSLEAHRAAGARNYRVRYSRIRCFAVRIGGHVLEGVCSSGRRIKRSPPPFASTGPGKVGRIRGGKRALTDEGCPLREDAAILKPRPTTSWHHFRYVLFGGAISSPRNRGPSAPWAGPITLAEGLVPSHCRTTGGEQSEHGAPEARSPSSSGAAAP